MDAKKEELLSAIKELLILSHDLAGVVADYTIILEQIGQTVLPPALLKQLKQRLIDNQIYLDEAKEKEKEIILLLKTA